MFAHPKLTMNDMKKVRVSKRATQFLQDQERSETKSAFSTGTSSFAARLFQAIKAFYEKKVVKMCGRLSLFCVKKFSRLIVV